MDNQGRPGYRLIENVGRSEPGSDIHTLLVGRMVSVTPLSLDLTSRVAMDVASRQLPAGLESRGVNDSLSAFFGWGSGLPDLAREAELGKEPIRTRGDVDQATSRLH